MADAEKMAFRIVVSSEDPEMESTIVKKLASEFIRLGIPAVTVIADDEHVNYVDGEVYNLTKSMGGVFQATPDETTAAHVRYHSSSTLN